MYDHKVLKKILFPSHIERVLYGVDAVLFCIHSKYAFKLLVTTFCTIQLYI